MAITLNGTTGITTPDITSAGSLSIDASAPDNSLVVNSTGNVGIGTSLPDTRLEVKHSSSSDAIKISGNADSVSPYLAFENQEGGTAYVRGRIRGASNGVDGGLIFQTGSAGSMAERMRIDSTGRVTMPYQPVFRAYHSGDIVWNSGNFSPVVYNTTKINIGSHYNTATGIFTAPVAGTYLFSVYEMWMGEASYAFTFASIRVNGSSETEFMREGTRSDYSTFGGTVILYLAANDQVTTHLGLASVDSGYARGGSTMNSFMGHLLG